ncbi:MAG: c-type cytochrome [Flavobacteriales bacterium]|jgi:cytochrome c peroxidase|nr:c-type cytochrome [Flavobacteriales bacterium]MBK7246445.1 c-type cytochrome [Flavobacteriales bacterium]MBK9060618.1 c-type cytochrome [Flavobacteriales bacterium]QQS72131.1 MAG: c-type cytochrome [Flavobacteriales bacterium]HQV37891.1 cytochrome c peroxidase [Flavobacteriales bacterium]
MRNKVVPFILIAATYIAITASGTGPHFVKLQVPEGWPKPTYDFTRNPLSEEGIALGRQLFYDPILSADSTKSCANCHLSYTAFTHVDHALSHGIHDSIGTRNSMTLVNLAWSKSFMWDGAVNHLDMQALAPISNRAELGESMAGVVKKLERSPEYRERFQAVFGKKVSGETVLKAMAQFELTLISSGSKYDQMMRHEEGAVFNVQEQHGYALFQAHCNSCHREPLFTSGAFANNGLPIDTLLKDTGRMHITGDPQDSLKFKVPSLRNVEFSGPYMHDGRFKKLAQVVAHYSDGIQHGPTLAPVLEQKIDLGSEDKVDLVAFLLTLTDEPFLFAPEHAFPRKETAVRRNDATMSSNTTNPDETR